MRDTTCCRNVVTRRKHNSVILHNQVENFAHRYVLGDRALHYLRVIGQTVEQLASLGLVEKCRFLQ